MAEEERSGEELGAEELAAIKKQRRRRLGIIGVVALGVLFGLVIVLAQCGGGDGDAGVVVEPTVELVLVESTSTAAAVVTAEPEPTATMSEPEPTEMPLVEVVVLPTYTPYPTYTPGAEYPTPEPWPTYTLYPTGTPYPTLAAAPTYTPYPTATMVPTATPYPTGTPAPTYTPYPTLAVPTPYPTATPRPTYTPYPPATPVPGPEKITLSPASGAAGSLVKITWSNLPDGVRFKGGSATINGQEFDGGLGGDTWGHEDGIGYFLVPNRDPGHFVIRVTLIAKGVNHTVKAKEVFQITGGG